MSTLQRYNRVEAEVTENFVLHLEEFSQTLTAEERRLLESTLLAAMPPHDRVAAGSAALDILNDEELEILRQLEQTNGGSTPT